jgi:uncharacterized protein DUF4397
MRRSFVSLSLALGLTAGCGNGGVLGPSDFAALRVYNASPDSPPVDILLRGGVIASSLAYGFGRRYVYVNGGAGEIRVQNSATSDPLLSYQATMDKAGAYTFAVTGTSGSLQPVFLTDDTTAAPTGSFKLRMVHLAPLGPAMDLYITGPSDDLAAATPAIVGLGFTAASAYITAAPGSDVRFRITQAGTKTVLREVGTFSVTSGQGVTLFLIGSAGAGGGGAPYSSQLVADHAGTN